MDEIGQEQLAALLGALCAQSPLERLRLERIVQAAYRLGQAALDGARPRALGCAMDRAAQARERAARLARWRVLTVEIQALDSRIGQLLEDGQADLDLLRIELVEIVREKDRIMAALREALSWPMLADQGQHHSADGARDGHH